MPLICILDENWGHQSIRRAQISWIQENNPLYVAIFCI